MWREQDKNKMERRIQSLPKKDSPGQAGDMMAHTYEPKGTLKTNAPYVPSPKNMAKIIPVSKAPEPALL